MWLEAPVEPDVLLGLEVVGEGAGLVALDALVGVAGRALAEAVPKGDAFAGAVVGARAVVGLVIAERADVATGVLTALQTVERVGVLAASCAVGAGIAGEDEEGSEWDQSAHAARLAELRLLVEALSGFFEVDDVDVGTIGKHHDGAVV